MGKLVKIPGVSMKTMTMALESLKEAIVSSATDSQYNARWVAMWKVLEGASKGKEWVFDPKTDTRSHVDTDDLDVQKAKFVSAEGGTDGREEYYLGRDAKPALLPELGKAVAKAANGTWKAEAVFAYAKGSEEASFWGAKKVGDTFRSESDSYRGGTRSLGRHSHGVVTVPITLRVRASYIKKEQVIRYSAEFKSSGAARVTQEHTDMIDMANVANYTHKVEVPDGPPIFALSELEANSISGDIEGSSVVENDDTEWPDGILGEADGAEVSLESMLPWHGDPLVEQF